MHAIKICCSLLSPMTLAWGKTKRKKQYPKKKHLSIPFKAYFKLKPILIDRV